MWIWESIWIGLDQMWTQSDLIWTGDGMVAMVKDLFAVCFVQNAERSHRILQKARQV